MMIIMSGKQLIRSSDAMVYWVTVYFFRVTVSFSE